MICPECKLTFHFDDDDILRDLEGSTCDCPHCKVLLILKNTFPVDFHAYIHSQDPRWPVDGKGTGIMIVD